MVDVVEEEGPEGRDGIRSLSLREERVEGHERLDGEVDGVDDLWLRRRWNDETKSDGGRKR